MAATVRWGNGMDIQDLKIFVRVAVVQNLSAVGAELALTPGTISKRIQALEDALNVRLFDRTTRSIRITEEGRLFLEHVERILVEVDQAVASVEGSLSRPRGKLKIAAPANLGRRSIAPAICAFMRAYPEIEVQLDLSDRAVNLQEEGYDIAVRTGVLSDSTLIARRLASDRQVIAAAPSYLAEHRPPRTPQELEKHNCLVLGDQWSWSLTRSGTERTVRISGRLRSNSSEFLRHAALDGQGVLRISEARVAEDIEQGGLVRILPDYDATANAAIWAVYPTAKHVPPRLRVLIDFLADWFREETDGAASSSAPPADGRRTSKPSAGKARRRQGYQRSAAE